METLVLELAHSSLQSLYGFPDSGESHAVQLRALLRSCRLPGPEPRGSFVPVASLVGQAGVQIHELVRDVLRVFLDQFGYAQVLDGGNEGLIVPHRYTQNPFARPAVSPVALESDKRMVSLVLFQKVLISLSNSKLVFFKTRWTSEE